jgi:Holliday junction resolvase
MTNIRNKGYRTERKIRLLLEKAGWKVVRAGASFGEADLICIKKGVCLFFQIKSTKKKIFYYYGYMKRALEGIPFFVVMDFGYGKIRVLHPKSKIKINDGITLEDFLHKINRKQI